MSDEGSAGCGAPLVWFSREVIVQMAAESARTFPLETGGVLMGYIDASGEQAVVHACTGPGPHAMHGAASFVPDHEFHEREVARIYAESGRVWSYLGDWHSHPNGRLGLSTDDRNTLGRIARSVAARVPHPLMAVIAGRPARGESWAGQPEVSTLGDELRVLGFHLGTWRLARAQARWPALMGRRPITRCALSVLQRSAPATVEAKYAGS